MSIFFFEKYAHFVVAYPKPRNQVMDFYWSSFYMAPDANTKGFSLTSRSLVPVVVGLPKASQCCPCIFIGVLILWSPTLSRPAHGYHALTYACGNAALIAIACTSCRRH
jgi:hypothetical protein